jgi:hypothetical protein
MNIYGPYVGKDKRSRCVIVHDNGRITTKSYPRLIMEAHLGRSLLPEEDVHHLDEDVTNNDISNLEIILHTEHCREHSLKYTGDIFVQCVYCGEKFALTPKQQSSRKRELNRGKHGPFCSRTCSGKYGTDIQRAAKQGCLD